MLLTDPTKSLQKSIPLTLLLTCLVSMAGVAGQRTTTAAQPHSGTGTYKFVLNELNVLELPEHKVRISFSGVWPNDRRRRESRNVRTFDETVKLSGGKAVVKLQFGQDPCLINLDFKASKVIVTQEGSLMGCGFGFNVEAEGTYLKTSSQPPKLPPAPDPGAGLDR